MRFFSGLWYLCFEVRVLGEVAPGARSLGTERLLDAIDVTEGGDDGLEVQLGRLGQVGLGKRRFYCVSNLSG